jgi:hypothetical protein
MGRPIKLMWTWPQNEKGGFETRPYVFFFLLPSSAWEPTWKQSFALQGLLERNYHFITVSCPSKAWAPITR